MDGLARHTGSEEDLPMKRVAAAIAAISVFALSGGAFAQEVEDGMYLMPAGSKHMVMRGANAAGTELRVGAGIKPDPCPPGDFYTTDPSQQLVMRCDDDMQFALAEPQGGEMMPSGQPYPKGALKMNTIRPNR
jgi:hypothetical protein